MMDLEIALHQEKSRPIQANDTADLDFLSLALPYCSAVVTERIWGHLAKKARSESEFATQILTSVRDLEGLLKPSNR